VYAVQLKLTPSPSTGTDKNDSFPLLARDQDNVRFPSSLTPSRELEGTVLLVYINIALPWGAQWGISEMRQTEVSRFGVHVTVHRVLGKVVNQLDASQIRNQLNTLLLSQSLYCVLILYMFRASSVHLQEALH
jgi:hypothetical protein